MMAARDGRLTKSPCFGIAGQNNVYVGAMVVFDLEISLSVLDRDGQSVLQLAEQHKSPEVARILRRHLEMIITNQTNEIQKGGDSATMRPTRGRAGTRIVVRLPQGRAFSIHEWLIIRGVSSQVGKLSQK